MGAPKQHLPLGAQTFLDRVSAVAREITPNVRVIERDLVDRCGPLGGIFTALKQTQAQAVLFLPCDMPSITADLLWKIISIYRRVPVPVFTRTPEGAGFPFLLPREVFPQVEAQVQHQQFSLQQLRQAVHAALYEPTPAERKQLRNVNTRRDYQRALQEEAARKVLEVSGLQIRRDKVQIVRNLDWLVQRGEHWVILGANGSGKTSLLSALLGYMSPTAGIIRVLGKQFGRSDWRALRNHIGLVSSSIRQMMPEHEPALITVASGAHAMIDYWGEPSQSEKTRARKLLRQVECAYAAERPWYCLSQGERQRVLIGRALMAKPKLLILDEPCAGLDPAAREKFLQFIDRLGAQNGAPSLVLVTHHVEEIMPVFTHAMLLKNGTVVGQGALTEVLTSTSLAETFSTPLKLRRQAGRLSLHFTEG